MVVTAVADGLRVPRSFAAALLWLTIAGCSTSPRPAERMVAQVARLDEVVSIVEELVITDFEGSADCRNIGYARGSFGSVAQEGCAREGTVEFDDRAMADHDELARAIEASGVRIYRILDPTYGPDGRLKTAWFVLEGAPFLEYWQLLYDPTNALPKQDVPGRSDFTALDGRWWFVSTPDD